MSTFTKEQLIEKLQHRISVASGFPESEKAQMDLELARIALASLEAEPAIHRWRRVTSEPYGPYPWHYGDFIGFSKPAEGIEDEYYYSAPPAPVSVPDEVSWEDVPEEITEDDMALASAWAHGFNQCRDAMLQGAGPVTTAYKLPDDFICMLTGRAKYLREKGEIKSPELLERADAALQGESVNTSSIPNGWKLVPIDPTKDMLRAGQSVVGFWLNTVLLLENARRCTSSTAAGGEQMNEEITLRDIIKAIVILKPGVTLAEAQMMIWAKTARSTMATAMHGIVDQGLFTTRRVENKGRHGLKCNAYYPTRKLLDSFRVTNEMIEYLGLEVKVKPRKIKREDNTVFESCKQSPAMKRVLWFYGRGDLPEVGAR